MEGFEKVETFVDELIILFHYDLGCACLVYGK